MFGSELTAPCVLIVSDDEAHASVLRRQVQSLGVHSHELADCARAIAAASHCDVALIVIDLQKPMMDGIEAVRQLRTAARTRQVPVIIIAEGRTGLADRQRGQSLGAVCCLRRQDLDFDALQDQVRLLLELHLKANALQLQIAAYMDEHARIAADNPQVRALQPSLHRHLLQDPLTGLPNRIFFDLHLMALIRRAPRGGRGFGLVWLDVDHLKRINERHQRGVGDRTLLAVAQRLESLVRSSDVLARIEGDTFGLILDGVSDNTAAEAALHKLLAAVGEPLELSLGSPLGEAGQSQETVTLIPTLSVGVALYPRHGEDQATLLGVAEQAALEVLRMGGDGVRVGWSKTGIDPVHPGARAA